MVVKGCRSAADSAVNAGTLRCQIDLVVMIELQYEYVESRTVTKGCCLRHCSNSSFSYLPLSTYCRSLNIHTNFNHRLISSLPNSSS